jgi:hypothetical protein
VTPAGLRAISFDRYQAAAKSVRESAVIVANLAIHEKQIEADRTAETFRIGKQRDIALAH